MGRRVGSGKRGQRRTCPVWLGVLASHLRAGVCAASSACTKVIRLMNKTPALLIYTAYECIWTETLLSRAYLPIYPRTQSCRGGGRRVCPSPDIRCLRESDSLFWQSVIWQLSEKGSPPSIFIEPSSHHCVLMEVLLQFRGGLRQVAMYVGNNFTRSSSGIGSLLGSLLIGIHFTVSWEKQWHFPAKVWQRDITAWFHHNGD